MVPTQANDIDFSQVGSPEFNLTYYQLILDPSNFMDIEMLPGSELYEDKLNFRWKLIAQRETEIVVDLIFDYPEYVSAFDDTEKMAIRFKNTQEFMKPVDSSKFAIPDNYIIKFDVVP